MGFFQPAGGRRSVRQGVPSGQHLVSPPLAVSLSGIRARREVAAAPGHRARNAPLSARTA